MRRTLSAVAAGILAGAGLALAAPGPAQATDDEDHATICPTWQLRSGSLDESDAWQWHAEPAEGSEVVDEDTVVLTKPPGEPEELPGTEFAAFDVGFTSDKPVAIRVTYNLEGEASSAAGAVRLFYYTDADADTVNDAPDGVAIAVANGGSLVIEGVTRIGTLGMVYDGSNPTRGKAFFGSMVIGDTKVKFTDVCAPASPTPTPTEPEPSDTSTPPTETESPAPGGGGGLPVTGASVPVLAGVAGLLVSAGAGMLLLARRRRFEA